MNRTFKFEKGQSTVSGYSFSAKGKYKGMTEFVAFVLALLGFIVSR